MATVATRKWCSSDSAQVCLASKAGICMYGEQGARRQRAGRSKAPPAPCPLAGDLRAMPASSCWPLPGLSRLQGLRPPGSPSLGRLCLCTSVSPRLSDCPCLLRFASLPTHPLLAIPSLPLLPSPLPLISLCVSSLSPPPRSSPPPCLCLPHLCPFPHPLSGRLPSCVFTSSPLLCPPPPSPHSFGRNFLSTGLSASPRCGAGPCRPPVWTLSDARGPYPALQGLRSAFTCPRMPPPQDSAW